MFTGVANLVRFNLIHLAFKLKKPVEGHQYLDALLKNSPNEDKARLEAAATIMETDPYSAEANQQLQLIAQNSPLYQQALKMLSTSLGSSEFFEEFKSVQPANDIDPHEIQNINRAIYHKIKNEIAIFSEIIYGFLEDYPASTSFLTGLVAKIQQLNQKINEYRQEEKQQLDKVTQSEYQHIISIISKTAHDLVDFVGNEMAIFRETVQLELEEESEHHALYSDIFKQIQLTEVALSDLKSVNEGIKISTTQFKLTELISRWKETLTFAHADIDTFIYDTVTDKLEGFNAIEEAEIALNGENAKLYGVEFAWSKQLSELPEPFNGLLLSANLTLAKSDASIDTIEGPRNIRLPQQSDKTGNFTVGYDDEKLSLRLAANYKSDYLDEINAESPTHDIIVDDHFQLDFSARYFIQDNIQIFFEAININDEPFYSYVSQPSLNAQFEDYGPTFKLGATITNF